MKILLANNTSHYHNGCAAVIEFISDTLKKQGHEIIATHKSDTYKWSRENVLKADAVVVNGEGTLHHKGLTHWIPKILTFAQKNKKKTYLVNTVWARNRGDWSSVLKRLNYINVRELSSRRELKKQYSIDAPSYLDFCFFNKIDENSSYKDFEGEEIFGDYFMYTKGSNPVGNKKSPRLVLQKKNWSYIVKSLRTCSLYTTGRHHGLYAACKARVPFVTYKHNCHKIKGLFKGAGVEIPIPRNAQQIKEAQKWARKNIDVYLQLFDWMEEQPIWQGIP